MVVKTRAERGPAAHDGLLLRRIAVVTGGIVLLAMVAFISLLFGSGPATPGRSFELLLHPDGSFDSYQVRVARTDRTLIGLAVGAALAVAGAVMQAVTRNPLADPGILGVNAGSSLAVVLGVAYLGMSSIPDQIVLAGIGGLVATILVYAVGRAAVEGATPLRLTLAGVALSTTVGGFVSAILLADPQAFDTFRFWDIGSLTRSDTVLVWVTPIIGFGLVLALILARPLGDLALGDDVAIALGRNVGAVRLWSLVAVTVLCASATAAAGPIGFVGLMVPLIASAMVGAHRGWIMVVCIVYGPALVIAADLIGRIIARPGELQVGLLTAFVGAPALLLMAYRMRGAR